MIIGYEHTQTDTYLLVLDPSSATQIHYLPSVQPAIASIRHNLQRLETYGQNAQVLYFPGEYLWSEEIASLKKTPIARNMGQDLLNLTPFGFIKSMEQEEFQEDSY